jgi:hypothetical protein
MSKSSVKASKRSAKPARRSGKKTAKVVRAAVKKSAPTARRPSATSSRALRNRPAQKSTAPMIRTSSPPMQPVATLEIPVKAHKYNLGETVYYNSPSFGRAAAVGSYTVVKLLPTDGDDYQYRIKNAGEAFERVAKESQLDRA